MAAIALLTAAITQLVLSASAADAPRDAAPSAATLEAGKPVERELGRGEAHIYEVVVPRGQVVTGVVDQRGADVAVRIINPSGAAVATVDSPNGVKGPEPWTIGLKAPGVWRLEVAPITPDAAPGRYEARIDAVIPERDHAERLAGERYESPRMRKLWREHYDEGAAAIDRFAKEAEGRAPLVEPIEGNARGDVLITFLWRGEPGDGYLAVTGAVLGGLSETPMRSFEGTDLLYLTARVPESSRFTYAFRHGPPRDSLSMKQRKSLAPRMDPDPWNPRKHLTSSLVELPGAPAQPWAQRESGVPEGKIINTSIRSEILGEERKVGVYLPSGFDPAGGPYPYVVVFDGEDIKSWIPVPTILDNLIAKGKVPPMLAVLVESQGTRMRDLGMSPRFAEFLAKELAPWMRREHRASADPAKATLSGASLGGLASAYVAFHHPDVFGNALSQSGSFWFTPGAFEVEARHQLETGAMMREYRDAPRRPVRLWMEVGLFEGAGQILGASLLAQNRHMRDVLIAKGYDVSYREFAGGHDVACWRGSFADGLIHLAGAPPPR